MPTWSFRLDPRYFQVVFQLAFLLYGLFLLHWEPDPWHYLASIGGILFFQYLLESIRTRKWVELTDFKSWGFSGLISAMSLILLLKTTSPWISLLASFLTVASKYAFRYKGKHIFNPSAFGIVATLLLTNGAWLSPAQWGTGTVLLFAVVSFGFIVVTRVQKLDISLAFLFFFGGFLFIRQVVYLDWPMDFFWHSLSTGSLLLFTFFMISDPRTSPNHPVARIIWAFLIAAVAFYLSAFKWKYNTPIWVLVAAGPLVPVLDHVFRARAFSWSPSTISLRLISNLKSIVMIRFSKKTAALLLLLAMVGQEAAAFCGFYVSKADGTLKNKTSQVILVRDGEKMVITMSNDFKGNVRDFAMVVPVPVVLKKSDIRVVDAGIFQRLNDYSKPRLVEYYDANPCNPPIMYESLSGKVSGVVMDKMEAPKRSKEKEYKVKVEASYTVGEYDIVILSAEESGGLKRWLDDNGYKIPRGAEEVLDPYIKSNLKFFVVKVNLEEKDKYGLQQLRPLQIQFESPKFMLPIRLGMANADGDQDMIVYAFTRRGRVESTNYRTISLPTGKNIPLFVKDNFGNFYGNLFEHQWKREGKSTLFLEYAWDVSPSNYMKCDPCVSDPPNWDDLRQAGVWWLDGQDGRPINERREVMPPSSVFFTRLHVRYNRNSFPQDLVFQTTPNTENFQARYIITHPATGEMDCEAGKAYLRTLKNRRQEEMEMLTYLTGKGYNDWDQVNALKEEEGLDATATYASIEKESKEDHPSPIPGIIFGTVALAGLAMLGFRRI